MRARTCILLLLMISLLTGCIATTKTYKPTQAEAPLWEQADRFIFPSDVRRDLDACKGTAVHWIGIVREMNFFPWDDRYYLELKLEQRYWDYVEDSSVQQEKIFLSPLGEGIFYFINPIQQGRLEEAKAEFSKLAAPPNLAIVYGTVADLRSGDPLLHGSFAKFVNEKHYATNIFQYEVKRDESGKVVLDENGMPELTNFETLKFAEPGRNQLKEDK
jgi:hypothetical protein